MNNMHKRLLKSFLVKLLESYELYVTEESEVIKGSNPVVGAILFNFGENTVTMSFWKEDVVMPFPNANHSEVFTYMLQDFIARIILMKEKDTQKALEDIKEFMKRHNIEDLVFVHNNSAIQVNTEEGKALYAIRTEVCEDCIIKLLGDQDDTSETKDCANSHSTRFH